MQQVTLGRTGIQTSVLGFGCAPLLGRVGRRDSLKALHAAFDAGITFYDTARSYGYGESEALLGDFLRGRRHQVAVSTKFGILPAKTSLIKEAIKPIARKILNIAPAARKAVQKQIGAQFSGNKFSVSVLRESLDTSLRKLGTDYVDFLFMHSAPATVLEQADLIDELEKMVSAGKVRSAGISSEYEVIEAALNTQIPVLQSFQFPCNVFDLRTTRRFVGRQSEFVAVANHPFGGVERAVQSKARLEAIAANFDTPAELQEKLRIVDEFVLADIVLNAILSGTGIQVVIPSMIQSTHLKANINAMENSRFQPNELAWLRQALSPQ